MSEPSEFSRALIAAAQGGKKLELQKLVGELLDAGYKPTEADLFAIKYFFTYETRGRRPQRFDVVQKLAREIRDCCDRTGVTQAEAFESFKFFAELKGYKPEEFDNKFRDKVLTELRRSKK
jgi:hypothetical protein